MATRKALIELFRAVFLSFCDIGLMAQILANDSQPLEHTTVLGDPFFYGMRSRH
jgi:hypothetical protein